MDYTLNFELLLIYKIYISQERQEILRIHVRQWEKPPSAGLLSQLAEQAVGYCGSDLRALCSEAVIQGLRRRYPQIYESSQKLLLDPNAVKVSSIFKHVIVLTGRISSARRYRLGLDGQTGDLISLLSFLESRLKN
jgi:hypothetical protein